MARLIIIIPCRAELFWRVSRKIPLQNSAWTLPGKTCLILHVGNVGDSSESIRAN